MATRSIRYKNPTGVQRVIDHLKNTVGINFLALDFDQTILDIHTGGNWKGSLEELFPHIRPVYAHLIRAALTNDMEVAVVTFTCQTKFVRGVLDHIFAVDLSHSDAQNETTMDARTLEAIGVLGIGNVVDTSQKIPIRGGDRSWSYTGRGSLEGKQAHMASAVEELDARREEDSRRATSAKGGEAEDSPMEPITRKTTLLLDDDGRNIRHALNAGVRAVWFNPKKPQRLLPDLLKLE